MPNLILRRWLGQLGNAHRHSAQRKRARKAKEAQLGVEQLESRLVPSVVISEVDPNGSSRTYGADWFEVTNTGPGAVSTTGWKMDDNSNSSSLAVPMTAMNIAEGESVIFMETSTLATTKAAFLSAWFGASPPANLQIGAYSGSGVGLGTGGDAVNLFDAGGNRITGVSFNAASATGGTFDNTLGLGSTTLPLPTVSTASVTGVDGAFASASGGEIGSPGHTFTGVDLSRYTRVGRFDLPEPTRTTPPNGFSLLAQEASAVTYDWDTDTLFVVGDGGTSVVQVSKTGQLIDSMTLAPGNSPQGTDFYDTEGVTYVGGGKFVMTEERDRQLVLFTYAPGTTLTRAQTQTVKLGTTIGNIGLEGVSYDPLTTGATPGFIVVKEKDPESIFQTNVDFVGLTATNGSPTATGSNNLFDPALASLADFSDVFALSNLPSLNGQTDSSHLLVLSQESGQIINVDRSGTVYSRLTIQGDPGNPLSVPDQTHEGVTMDRNGFLYVVSENGGGDSNHPQLWVYAPSTATNLAPTAVSLNNTVTSIPENTSTAAPVKLADITVTDDGLGTNTLSLSGPDAGSFQIIGSSLYLTAGTALNHVNHPTYNVTVNVDDLTVGASPDASTNYTLTVTAAVGGTPQLIISEVAPWASGNSPLGADWFEVTNIGTATQNITGWKMDDNSNSFGSAVALNGVTNIAPGESVIFIELGSGHTAGLDAANFRFLWFGNNPPANLQIGSYGGSGVSLSTGGDAVNLFDAGGTVQTRIDFGASPGGPFPTFDNSIGLTNATVTALSAVGVNGGFVATHDVNEIGSPGTIGASSTPIVTITATDASAAEAGQDPGTFRISRTGSTVGPLTVTYNIATGAGQATSADYTPTLTSAVTIPSGQSFVDITITPVDDALVEGSETVTITLGDSGSYDVGASATATVTIADNDFPNQAPTAVTLTNTVPFLVESTSTASPVRVADIAITDDNQGTNTLSLTGADAGSFQIIGSSLYLRAGTTLSFLAQPTYNVTVNVDDATVGSTPDASTSFTLTITQAVPAGSIIVSEVAPWSSSNGVGLLADWFEVTNIGTVAISTTAWKMDDNSNAFGSAVPMSGIASIAPGESVIFIELGSGHTAAGDAANFRTLWFGASAPAGLQIGSYAGSGVGLGTGGDAVNLFDAGGNLITRVDFGSAPGGPFATFDNPLAVSNATIAQLSVVGVHGAFAAASDVNEIGSPGTYHPNDAPSAQASSVTTNEDTARTFTVADFQFTDHEGDSLASITIGALSLAAGDTLTVDQGAGPVAVTADMTITAAQLPTLTYTPAGNASGAARSSFTFTVNDAGLGTVSATMTINVTALADTPNLSVAPAAGVQGVAVSLNIQASLNDTDGSETLSITVTNLPAGASLSAGSNVGGVWTLTPAQLAGLKLIGAAPGSFSLHVIATATETSNNDSASAAADLSVFVAGITLNNGVLTILGTAGDDVVAITDPHKTLSVYASFLPGNHTQTFSLSAVSTIVAYLGDGDDVAVVDDDVKVTTLLDGGRGNDVLQAGSGDSVLVGGAGNDILIGGKKRDILIGGLGTDTLLGRGGQDILIAGATSYDANANALFAALAEWARGDLDLAGRMAHLRAGGGLNGSTVLTSSTVSNDGAVDILSGGSGNDWYWANLTQDILLGKKKNETVN